MLRTSALYAVVALGVLLASTVSIEEHRVAAERARAVAAVLNANNVIAERDSTRDVALNNKKAAALLGDSLRLVQRLVVQVAQRADALDNALGGQRLARYSASALVDSLQAVVASAAATTDSLHSTRRATFDIRKEPYTIAAQVDMPPLPDSATIAIRVRVDPIYIDARVSCGAADEHGVRPASIAASSAPWATVRFGRVEQSPDLCSPGAVVPQPKRQFVEFRRFVIGGGPVRTIDGRWTWGLLMGAGFAGTG